MNAWTIYWILQLDTISSAMGLLSFLGVVIVPMSWSFVLQEIRSGWGYLVASAISFVWVVAALLATFLPSTKTAAAMVIVPAIANNETIRKESGELYDLAKQALREAVTDKAKEAVKSGAK